MPEEMTVLERLAAQRATFDKLSERLTRLMNGTLELVASGRVPSGGEVSSILDVARKLQDRYNAIYKLAVKGSLQDCLPEPELSVSDYAEVIHANVQRENNERARSRLEHFSGVESKISEFKDALAPFQQHTREILDSQNIDAILAALESPDLFMQALDGGVSADSLGLLEAIGQKFNPRVMLGLALSAYFDPDTSKNPDNSPESSRDSAQSKSDAVIETKAAAQPVTSNVSNIKDRVQDNVAVMTSSDKAESEPDLADIALDGLDELDDDEGAEQIQKKCTAVNQAVLKFSKPGASTFLGEISSLGKMQPDVVAILPLLMRFGVMNLPQLLMFYRWFGGRVNLDDNDKADITELHSRILATLDLLASKGFIARFEDKQTVRFDLGDDLDDVDDIDDIENSDESEQAREFSSVSDMRVLWCLSNYTIACMKKEKVVQQKTRTGTSNWRVPYNPNACYSFSTTGTASESALQDCCRQNVLLMMYFRWLYEALPLTFASALKSLRWKSDHYQVDIPCEGEVYSSAVVAPDGTNVGENVLLVYGMTILPEKFNPECKRLFVLKNDELYQCNPFDNIEEQLRQLKPISVVPLDRTSAVRGANDQRGADNDNSDDSSDDDSTDNDPDDQGDSAPNNDLNDGDAPVDDTGDELKDDAQDGDRDNEPEDNLNSPDGGGASVDEFNINSSTDGNETTDDDTALVILVREPDGEPKAGDDTADVVNDGNVKTLAALLRRAQSGLVSSENVYSLTKTPSDSEFYAAALSMLDRADALFRSETKAGENRTADSEILHAILLNRAAGFEKEYYQSAQLSRELQLATNILLKSAPVGVSGEMHHAARAAYTADCLMLAQHTAMDSDRNWQDSCDATLQLAGTMFSMLVPENAQDYTLNFQNQDLFQRYDEMFGMYPELRAFKPLFNKMLDIKNLTPTGFSPTVLAHLGQTTENDAQANVMAMAARKLLVIPPRDVKALEILYHKRLGEGSPIYECMSIIAGESNSGQSDQKLSPREKLDFVKSVLAQYCDEDGSLNPELVEEDIDAVWEDSLTFTKGKLKPLVATRRTQTVRAFNDRIELMVDWIAYASAVQAMQENGLDIPNLVRLRDELTDLIEKLRVGLRESTMPRVAVLDLALRRMLEVLTGQNSYVFSELLATGVILMTGSTGETAVTIEPDFSVTAKYYEPWRNVLRHITKNSVEFGSRSSDPDVLRAVRAEILEGAALNEQGRGDNLHQLALIDRILGSDSGFDSELEESGISPEDEQSARSLAVSITESFRHKLEIAWVYDRVNLDQKLSIESLIDECQDRFFETGDFACWRDFLRALELQVKSFTEGRRTELLVGLESLREQIDCDCDAEELTKVQACIDADNFLVAEEYMNRLEAGKTETGEQNSKTGEKLTDQIVELPHFFTDFLSDGVFKTLLQECQNHPKDSLKKFGVDWLQKRLPSQAQDGSWTSDYYPGHVPEDSRELLRNWPSREGNATPAQVQLFFKHLGFNIVMATSVNSQDAFVNGVDRFQLDLTGSELWTPYSEMSALVVYGHPTEQQLVDTVARSISDGKNNSNASVTFVLIDTPLTLTSRRSVGEIMKRQWTASEPFVLIDQLLVLYLASLAHEVRIPALLQCALPYTAYQPFDDDNALIRRVSGAAGNNTVERARALDEILNLGLDRSSACLVYGGDKLGKTTLLRTAYTLGHDVGNKRYTVYDNIAECSTDKELTVRLASDIRDRTGLNLNLNFSSILGLFDGAKFEQLCQKLNERFKNGNINSLLLLLDDADNFLASCTDTSSTLYALRTLIELRDKTNGAFKFVLSTVHNPESYLPPDILAQLGTPVCLKPLTWSDALVLLACPLSYVGFDINPDTLSWFETILAHTNTWPGQLDFIGRWLISDLNSNYTHYYNNSGNLPFTLTAIPGAGERVLGSSEANDALCRSFLEALGAVTRDDGASAQPTTGDSDRKRYFMLACAITWLYHIAQHQACWTVDEILASARDNDLRCLKDETPESCRVLLDEMCDMGVLVRSKDRVRSSDKDGAADGDTEVISSKVNRYRLARRRFVDFIGRTPDVLIDVMIEQA